MRNFCRKYSDKSVFLCYNADVKLGIRSYGLRQQGAPQAKGVFTVAKDIRLILRSRQYDPLQTEDAQDSEETYVESTGIMYRENDTFILRYEESELTGMEGSVTHLCFPVADPETVTMLRDGEVRTNLVFSPGGRYVSAYETFAGSFEVTVVTQSVRNTVSYSGGDIEIVYTLEIRGVVTQRTFLSISVNPM